MEVCRCSLGRYEHAKVPTLARVELLPVRVLNKRSVGKSLWYVNAVDSPLGTIHRICESHVKWYEGLALCRIVFIVGQRCTLETHTFYIFPVFSYHPGIVYCSGNGVYCLSFLTFNESWEIRGSEVPTRDTNKQTQVSIQYSKVEYCTVYMHHWTGPAPNDVVSMRLEFTDRIL